MMVLLWMGLVSSLSIFLGSAVGFWMSVTFEAALTCVTAFCGIFWFGDLILSKRKKGGSEDNKEKNYINSLGSIFPVLFFVFVLRSFLFEPFRIPSGSMLPSLHVGDFVLVNKFDYGIRLPITGSRIFGSGQPDRGDIAVFRYPNDPDTDYIKRIIGLPGDQLSIIDGHIYLNGKSVPVDFKGAYNGKQRDLVGGRTNLSLEKMGDKEYSILNLSKSTPKRPINITVPEGQYFVMGDNRDHSSDSRYWGFLPDKFLKGRALFVWLNWGDEFDLSRIGTSL